jgi:NAD(P)-dependent dehydrogenase (short-subunit alcohol dehydrogenase family)
MSRTAVVTGANRGLGLEFVRQLAAAGDEVVATSRHPDRADELAALARESDGRVTTVALEVSDPASVAAAARAVGDRFDRLDLLINNAGIMASPHHPQRATAGPLAEVEPEAVLEILRVNSVGPVLVTQALAGLLAAARDAVVVNLTSGLGSISGTASPVSYGYAMSKAALNMLSRYLALDLRRQGTVVVAMSPGWVSTDMGGPAAPLDPPESVKGMLAVVAGLTPADSGRYLDHTGEDLPF